MVICDIHNAHDAHAPAQNFEYLILVSCISNA